MKKTLIVAVLAVALVFAFAATAMARPNGNIYISWDTANGTNNAVPTPHAGYTTSTEKCNVCHSVHYAAPANYTWEDTPGGPWTSGTTTEMLLRSSVSDACNYCHITTSIGGVQLYGGIATNYTAGSTFAHNGSAASCSGCHAVHGANTFQGPNETKILRARTDRPIQAEVVGINAAGTYEGSYVYAAGRVGNSTIAPIYTDADASGSGIDEAIDDTPGLGKYTQQVAFCTQCHAEYTDASESTIMSSEGYYDGAFDGVDYKGHPLKAAEADFVAAGDTITGPAAFVGSETCRSCHDAGNVNESTTTLNSFPHYTLGYFVFSNTGEFAGDVDAADATKMSATDGNCLKCHVNAGQTAGVNITY